MSDAEIKTMMARLEERIKSMDERGERMEDDLQKLKHVLVEGNGSPAMTVQVATMDQRIKQLEEDRADKKVPRHVSLGIWVSLVIAVGSILVGFVNH